jgi:hypothetical protein
MSAPYLCPNCKSNRTRFNLLEQVVKPIKMNAQSGEITNEYSNESLDPFHLPYRGPAYKVQCATCGLIEDERAFIKRAESSKNQH